MPYASPAHIYADNDLQDINDQDFDPSLEIESIKGELICAQESLKKVSNEMKLLQKDSAYKKIKNLDEKYESTISDMLNEEELLVLKNDELLDELTALKSTSGENAQLANFLDTKNGIINFTVSPYESYTINCLLIKYHQEKLKALSNQY